jgi:hypothetical protein
MQNQPVRAGMNGNVLAAALLAAAAMTPAQQVYQLVGTHACVNHESTGTVWRFTSVNEPFGAWLRASATFAPQNGQAAQTAVTFIGYDSDAKQWNIVSVSHDGSYYTRASTSRDLNGSRWTDAYPADGAKAIIRIPSATVYTFDLTTPQGAHSHVVCTRQ